MSDTEKRIAEIRAKLEIAKPSTEFCPARNSCVGFPDRVCEKPLNHPGWHKNGGLQWLGKGEKRPKKAPPVTADDVRFLLNLVSGEER